MSELSPTSNITSNVLHTGDKILTTGGNIRFDPDATYHPAFNPKLQEMQQFVKNGMQALLDRTLPTIFEEA